MEAYFTHYALKLKSFMWLFAVITAAIFISSFAFRELYSQHKMIGFILILVMLWTGSASLLIYYYAVIGAENLPSFFRWY